MTETNAPIPPPPPYICTHCGFGMTENLEFCPQCGTKLNAPRGTKSCATQIGIAALALLMVPSALMGACLIWFGAFGDSWYRDPSMFALGAIAIGLAVSCFLGIRNMNRR